MIDMSKWRSNDLANALLTRSMQAQASSPVEAFGQIAQSLMARRAIERNDASNKSLLAQALMGSELPESSRAAVMTSGSPNTPVQALPQNEQAKAAAAQQQLEGGSKMVGQHDRRSMADAGQQAAGLRTASPNNIERFNAMTLDEQAAFRAGYGDPYISRVEHPSLSPMTNRAPMLMTGKTEQEFPAFAAPGMGEQMTNRIAREQRMFETANASRVGSRAADNIADAAEPNGFDPAIATTLFEGRPFAAAMQAIARKITRSQGVAPGVAERVARTLMETDPQVARELLTSSGASEAASNQARAALIGALLVAGSAREGQPSTP